MSTGFVKVNASMNLKVTASLPTTPALWYGADDVNGKEWEGGEVVYNTADSRIYVQTATSGTTAAWKFVSTEFTDYP
jgi:hypothetical protein